MPVVHTKLKYKNVLKSKTDRLGHLELGENVDGISDRFSL